jgi:DNA-directed RNA polymerase specialized sigma24 family protein
METNTLLRKAIAELPEKYQALILLRDMQGVSITDAARLLGMAVPAVKTRHRRAASRWPTHWHPCFKTAPRRQYNPVRR